MLKLGDIVSSFRILQRQPALKSFAGLSATERPALRRAHSPLLCPPWIHTWLLKYLHSLKRQRGRKTEWSVCCFHLRHLFGANYKIQPMLEGRGGGVVSPIQKQTIQTCGHILQNCARSLPLWQNGQDTKFILQGTEIQALLCWESVWSCWSLNNRFST